MADPSAELPPIDPVEYAALVAQSSDADLAAGLTANGAEILDRVFASMAEHLDTERAREAEAVLEWHVARGDKTDPDRFQVVIRDGTCTARRGGDDTPDVTYRINGVDFLRLVTGGVTGPDLFMTGRLVVEGDMMLGAMTSTWFRTPGSPASTGA
jgi:putative sterol carrier protein